MLRSCLSALLAAALLTMALAAAASELWLLPPRFFVVPGTRQTVRVIIGQSFRGTRWPGTSRRLASFVQYAPHDTLDHTRAATRADTLDTAVEFAQPGVHLLALRTTDSFTELPPPAFNAYLQQAGLDNALARRQQRGEMAQPGRETYRRCAKTLVLAGSPGPATEAVFATVAGHPLELVPDQNPYALAVGASLTVRVLADGVPLRGALVQVWSPGPAAPPLQLRSNQNGRVLFKLSGAGSYLVSTVRMEPAPDAKVADWQSTWATLTFGVAGISGR